MTIAKQMEVRDNIKYYFDAAYDGEPIMVSRKQNKNVVILSEEEYNRLRRLSAYADKLNSPASHNTHRAASADQRSANMLTDNLIKLEGIRNLKDNWNGNGAPALPDALIEKVRILLTKLNIQPEIFPTALQTIQLEYDNSKNDHMEIEIGLTDTAEIFVASHIGEEYTENISTNPDTLNERVECFYE